MGLIKLANKLTKMFNALKPETQALAEPFLRSEKTFIKGIEKGNRNLLTNIKKKNKLNLIFKNSNEPLENQVELFNPFRGAFHHHKKPLAPSGFQLTVKRRVKTLDDVITKRHEVFETQEAINHRRDYIPYLRMNSKNSKYNHKLSKKIYDKHKHNLTEPKNKYLPNGTYLNNDKRTPEYIKFERDYVQHEDAAANEFSSLVKPIHKFNPINLGSTNGRDQLMISDNPLYFSHMNPNVLKKEHKVLANTPRSHNTDLFKHRQNSGEATDVSKKFNLNYGING